MSGVDKMLLEQATADMIRAIHEGMAAHRSGVVELHVVLHRGKINEAKIRHGWEDRVVVSGANGGPRRVA